MPITPANPIVIPAKTLDKMWVRRIFILAPAPGGEASAEVHLLPYNEQGDVAEDLVSAMNIQGIMAKASADPTSNIAKAMYFLLAAIDDEYKEQNP